MTHREVFAQQDFPQTNEWYIRWLESQLTVAQQAGQFTAYKAYTDGPCPLCHGSGRMPVVHGNEATVQLDDD